MELFIKAKAKSCYGVTYKGYERKVVIDLFIRAKIEVVMELHSSCLKFGELILERLTLVSVSCCRDNSYSIFYLPNLRRFGFV